jgi:hypothetical protein
MIRLRVVVFVLLAQCSSLFAQGVSVADAARRERDRRQELQVSKDALVKYLVSHSGASTLIEQIGKSFSDSTTLRLNQIPPDIGERLKTTGNEVFTPARLLPVFEQTLSIEMDNVSLEEVYSWYLTPTGAKVLQAEDHNSQKNAENAPATQPSAARAKLIEQLDGQTQATDQTVASIAKMTKAMLSHMLAMSQISKASKDALLQGFEQGFTANATERIRPTVRANYLRTYQPLSDDELQDYLTFLNTSAGRKFVRATWDALQKTLEQGGAETGDRFAQILRNRAIDLRNPQTAP